jgi:hypothetical protein
MISLCHRLAASAYEDVEWINKLVAWVADVATNRPRTKIIGLSCPLNPPYILEIIREQEYVLVIKSSRELSAANAYRMGESGKLQLLRSLSQTSASVSLACPIL